MVLKGAGLEAEAFARVAAAAESAQSGCGLFVLAEEALYTDDQAALQALLANQPAWSSIPIVLITSGGADRRAHRARVGFPVRTHVTLLERPLRAATLVAAVEAALGSREQQYEIRELLEERGRLLNSLEGRVTERTAKLQAMVAEMEAFSYSVSHDLRAPLRVMAGFAQVVTEDYSDQLPPEGHRLLRKISDAAQRMDRLTQDLLAYTRIANGEVTLETTDLDEVIDSTIESYPTLLESKKHIAIRRPLGCCLGHVPSLAQCFSNLLENAVKFARPGAPPEIEVFSELRGNRLRVYIADHGVGVEPRHRERIFGLFERADASTPGTGIGLAIVKRALERMKGSVGLMPSREGRTEFWIELAAAGES
jgi:signal transduction histidine kinase